MRVHVHHTYLASVPAIAADGATRPGSPTTARPSWGWTRGCNPGSSSRWAISGMIHLVRACNQFRPQFLIIVMATWSTEAMYAVDPSKMNIDISP